MFKPKTLFQKFKQAIRQKVHKMVDALILPSLVKWMQAGVKATKFHYNVKDSKECTIKLSDDLKTFIWEYDDQKYSSQVMHRFFKMK